MEPRLTLVTLGVADLDVALRFYRDGLGLPVLERLSDIVFFRLGSVRLALYPRHLLAKDANVTSGGIGFGGVTLAHNVRTRDAVDQLIAQARAAGARITQPPRLADWGGYSGYFADPDGHLWEVACTPDGRVE